MSDSGLAQVGKLLIFTGLGVVLLGAALLAANKLGLGRLPGDLTFKGKNTTVHFPIVTSLVVSVVLTVVLNLVFGKR